MRRRKEVMKNVLGREEGGRAMRGSVLVGTQCERCEGAPVYKKVGLRIT